MVNIINKSISLSRAIFRNGYHNMGHIGIQVYFLSDLTKNVLGGYESTY